ncbi:mucin-22-like [Penaeus chinensis]|uniref:mucin-22-like n=1 Tax=Penaeus chinensis TaxID=139456 RepID=UPI001FB82900|nr:mucin-22-like [Penaeus chinensis]
MAVLRVAPCLLVLFAVYSFPGHVQAHPYPPSIQETPDLLHLTSDSVQQKSSLPDSGQLSPDSVHQNSYTILPISVPVQLNLKAGPSTSDPSYLSQGPALSILNHETGSMRASKNEDRIGTDSPGDITGEDIPAHDLNSNSSSDPGLSPNPAPRYARKLANQIPVSTNYQSDKTGDLHVTQITDFRSSKISDQIVPDVGSAKLVSPQLPVLPSLGATRLIDLGSAKVIDTKAKSKPDDLKDVTIGSIRVTNLGSRPGVTYLGSVKASDLGLIKTADAANVQVGDSGFVQGSNITSAQVGDLKPNTASDLGSAKTNDIDYIQSSGLESLEARELGSAQTDGLGSAQINELGPTRLIDLGSIKVLDAEPTVDLGPTIGSDLNSALSSQRLTPGILSKPTKVAETGFPEVSYLGTVKLADLIPTKENDPEVDLETAVETVLKSEENNLETTQISTGRHPEFLQPSSPTEDEDSFPEIELDTSPFISLDSALFINLGPSTDPSASSTEVQEDSPLIDLISDTILEMVTKEPDQNSEPGPHGSLFSKPSPEKFHLQESVMTLNWIKTLRWKRGNGSVHGMEVKTESYSPIAELGDASKGTSEQSLFHEPGNHQTPVHGFAFNSDLQYVPLEQSSNVGHVPVNDRHFSSALAYEPSGYTPLSDSAYPLDPAEGEVPQITLRQNSAINTDNEPSSDMAFPSYDLRYNSASSDDFDYTSTLTHELEQYPDSEHLQQDKSSPTDAALVHALSTEPNQGTTYQDPVSNTAPRFFRDIAHDSGVEAQHSLNGVQGQSVLGDEQRYQVPLLEGDKSSIIGSEYDQLSATGSQYNQSPTTEKKQDQSLPIALQYDELPTSDPSLITGFDYEHSSVTGSQYNQSPVSGENHSLFSATGSQDNQISIPVVKNNQPQIAGSEYGLSSVTGSQYSQSLGIETPINQVPITGTQYDQSSVTDFGNIQTPSTVPQFAHSAIGSQNNQSPETVPQQQFSVPGSTYNQLETNVPNPDQSSVTESQYDQSLLTGPQYDQSLPTGSQNVQISATGFINESPVITSHHVQSLTSGSRYDQPVPITKEQNDQSVNNQFIVADFGEPAITGSQNDQFKTIFNQHSQLTTSGSQYNQPSVTGPQYNQPAITGSQYNQPAITGSLYNQPAITGSQYNQPAITGSQYNQPAITGSQYNQPAITGSQYNQPAITGSQFNQPAITGSQHNQPPITGSQYNQPAITGSRYNQPSAAEESKYTLPDKVNTGYAQQTNIHNPTGIDSASAAEYDYLTGSGSHADESGNSRFEYVQASDVQTDYAQPISTEPDYLQPREVPNDLQLEQGTDNVQGISHANDYVHEVQTGIDYTLGNDGLDYTQEVGQVSDYVVTDYSQTGPGINGAQADVPDYVQTLVPNYVQSTVPDYVYSDVTDQGSDHIELTNPSLNPLVDQNKGSVSHTNQISDQSQLGAVAPFIQPVILLPELIHPRELGSEYDQSSSLDSSAFQIDKTDAESGHLSDIKTNVEVDIQLKGKESEHADIGSGYPHANNPEASQVTPTLRTQYSQLNNVRLENTQTSAEKTDYVQPLSTGYESTQSRVSTELGHGPGLTNNLGSSQSVDPEYNLQETHFNPQSHENSLQILDLPSTPSKDFSDDTISGSEFGNIPTQEHGVISTFTDSPDFSASSSFNSQYEETNNQSPFSTLDFAVDHTADQHVPLPDEVPIARSIPESNPETQEYLIQDTFKPSAKIDTGSQDLLENEKYSYGLENTSAAEVVPSTADDIGSQLAHGQGFTSAPEFPSGVLDSTTTGIYEHSVSEEISNILQEANLSQTPVPYTGHTSDHYRGSVQTSTLGYTAAPTLGYSQKPLTYTPGASVGYTAGNAATPAVEYTPTPTPGYTPSVRGYTPALASRYTSPITQGYTTPSALGNTPTPAPRLASLSDYNQSPQPGLEFTPKPIQEYTPSPDTGRGPSPTVGYTPKPITGYTPHEQGRISASTQGYPPVTTQSPTQEPDFTQTTPSVLNRTPLLQKTNPLTPVVGITPSPYPNVTPTPAPILDNTLAPIQEYTTRPPQGFVTTPAYSQRQAPTRTQEQRSPGFGLAQAREQVPGTATPASQRRRKRPSKGRKHQDRQPEQLKPYVFAYSITDPRNGADFGQTEESDGNVVSGQYHVLLPDGRRQMVQYRADPINGFVSEVEYVENHLPGSGGFPFPAPRSRVPTGGSSPSASSTHPTGGGVLHGEPTGGAQYRLPTAGDQYRSPSIQTITRSLPPVEYLRQLSTKAADGNPGRTNTEVPSEEDSEHEVSAGGDRTQRHEPAAGSPVVRQLPTWVHRSTVSGQRGPTWRAYYEN